MYVQNTVTANELRMSKHGVDGVSVRWQSSFSSEIRLKVFPAPASSMGY